MIAHFLLFPQFGLYEDDYIYTLPAFNLGGHEWATGVRDAILHPIQARPLNHAVRRTLFALTLQGNSLDLSYLASWALITTNAFLLYRFLGRRLSPAAGSVAALLYLLHPADNARQIIMHQTDIHFGTLLLLGSLNLFAARRPIAAWLIGGASLINYESFYLPMLLVPFLLSPAPFREWRRTAGHAALWLTLIVGVAGIRYALGEDRTTAAAENPHVILSKIAQAMVIGPGTSLRLLLQRPVDALLHLSPLLAAAGAVVGAFSHYLLEPGRLAPQGTARKESAPVWMIVGGLAGLVFSYLFAFRPGSYPPILSIGRLTAQHVPGILCTSIAAGAAFHWAGAAWRVPSLRVTRIGLAVTFGLMGAFALQIQLTEYVAHWTKQRDFWHQIFAQSGDAADGDVILVDVEGSSDVIPITPGFPRFGSVNYPPQALRYFADIPPEWKHPPRVYGLWADTPIEAIASGIALKTPPYFGPSDQPVLENGRFIFFAARDGRLKRIIDPVDIRGHRLTPKPYPSSIEAKVLKPSRLFQGLVEPASAVDWFTIRNSRNYPQ